MQWTWPMGTAGAAALWLAIAGCARGPARPAGEVGAPGQARPAAEAGGSAPGQPAAEAGAPGAEALRYGPGRLEPARCRAPLGFSVISAEGARSGGEATIEFEISLSNPNKRAVTLEPTLSLVARATGEQLTLVEQRASRGSADSIHNPDGGVVVLANQQLGRASPALVGERTIAPQGRARTAWLRFSGLLAPGAEDTLELVARSRAGRQARCTYRVTLQRAG